MKTTRLTVDMPFPEHKLLKMASAHEGLSMRKFVTQAIFEKMEELEDNILAEKAHEVLERIEKGEEEVSDWEDVKQRLI